MQQISSVARAFVSHMGVMTTALIWNFSLLKSKGKAEISMMLRNKHFWKYIVMLNAFSLFSSYFLYYPGMDALAKAGIGAVSYPLMIGSCIVGFNLYSLFILREIVCFYVRCKMNKCKIRFIYLADFIKHHCHSHSVGIIISKG